MVEESQSKDLIARPGKGKAVPQRELVWLRASVGGIQPFRVTSNFHCVLAMRKPTRAMEEMTQTLDVPQAPAAPNSLIINLPAVSTSGNYTLSNLRFVVNGAPALDVTPSPIVLNKVIGTDAPSVSYWALEVAPDAALGNISSEVGLLAALARRESFA